MRHAARFLLVGTMNPEEGELRPQLLDRFGLTVEVAASREPDERVEVVRRRLAYDADPAGVRRRAGPTRRPALRGADRGRAGAAAARCALRRRARCGRSPRSARRSRWTGMRADIVMARTAIALAAWAGRDEVTAEDVRQAARLALPHRRRRNPFDAPGLDEDKLDETLRATTAARTTTRTRRPRRPDGPDGGRPGRRPATARRRPRRTTGPAGTATPAPSRPPRRRGEARTPRRRAGAGERAAGARRRAVPHPRC